MGIVFNKEFPVARGGKRPGAGRPAGVRNGEGKASRVDDIGREARRHTKEAMGSLLTVMRDKDAAPNARVRSASLILGYAWGQPARLDREDVGS